MLKSISPQRLIGNILIGTSLLCTLAMPVSAELPANLDTNSPDPAIKGLAIAQEAEQRDTGWQNHVANMTMVLTNRNGQESSRSMRLKTLEVEGDGDKSLTIFDEPRDVQGTAFLSFTHALSADEQWLYLPALCLH